MGIAEIAGQAEPQEGISSEEFKLWINDRITKLVVKQLVEIREEAKNYLASGATLSKDSDITTDRMVGRLEGLTELFNLFHETREATTEESLYDH